MISFNSSPKNQ